MSNLKTVSEILAIASGGSKVINLNEGVGEFNITSASPITLTSALNITVTGQLENGHLLVFRHNGGFTTDTGTGKHLSILGNIIPDEQALYEGRIEAYYDGAAWKVTLFPSIEGNPVLDGATIKAGTMPTSGMADDSVTNDKLSNITQGSIKVGGAANAPTDLQANVSGNVLIGDGTDINSVPLSGDVTVGAAGVTTIGVGRVTEAMLADGVGYDSGWKTINNYTGGQGFGLPNFTTGAHPLIRVIGRQVFIEGEIVLPLDDGGGGLIPASTFYKSVYRADVELHAGVDDGYTIFTGADYGAFRSNRPMLPANLRPSQAHRINSNGLIFRAVGDTGGTRSLVLTSALTVARIETDGDLLFSTKANLNDSAQGAGSAISNSLFRTVTTNVASGEFAVDYSGYKNSFTGATDNRVSSASIYTYPATFDGENSLHLGGFPIDITTSYLIDESIPLDDIIAAFDSI